MTFSAFLEPFLSLITRVYGFFAIDSSWMLARLSKLVRLPRSPRLVSKVSFVSSVLQFVQYSCMSAVGLFPLARISEPCNYFCNDSPNKQVKWYFSSRQSIQGLPALVLWFESVGSHPYSLLPNSS